MAGDHCKKAGRKRDGKRRERRVPDAHEELRAHYGGKECDEERGRRGAHRAHLERRAEDEQEDERELREDRELLAADEKPEYARRDRRQGPREELEGLKKGENTHTMQFTL